MSKHYKELQYKYEHSLDTMWALFKFGRDREKALEAKLSQIKVICQRTSNKGFGQVDDILEILKDDRNGVGVQRRITPAITRPSAARIAVDCIVSVEFDESVYMTREDFNNTNFGAGMFALYKTDVRQSDPDKYPISAVNFNEGLLELKCDDGGYIWVRCENIDIAH